jgi:hypothetical protein
VAEAAGVRHGGGDGVVAAARVEEEAAAGLSEEMRVRRR